MLQRVRDVPSFEIIGGLAKCSVSAARDVAEHTVEHDGVALRAQELRECLPWQCRHHQRWAAKEWRYLRVRESRSKEGERGEGETAREREREREGARDRERRGGEREGGRERKGEREGGGFRERERERESQRDWTAQHGAKSTCKGLWCGAPSFSTWKGLGRLR